jgi:hypothetical protein
MIEILYPVTLGVWRSIEWPEFSHQLVGGLSLFFVHGSALFFIFDPFDRLGDSRVMHFVPREYFGARLSRLPMHLLHLTAAKRLESPAASGQVVSSHVFQGEYR